MARVTFPGMAMAAASLIRLLETTPIDDDLSYRAFDGRVSAMLAELNAAWVNTAQADEAADLKERLLAAWHAATGGL